MKTDLLKHTFAYALAASLLCPALSVKAQAGSGSNDFQPVELINCQAASFTVPCPYNTVPTGDIPLQLFDVGQVSTSPVTFDAIWTPSSVTSDGIFIFMGDGKMPVPSSYYQLTISGGGTLSLSLHTPSGRVGLGTGTCNVSPNVPFHFQLQENAGTFTVVDPNTNQSLCTGSDNTITTAPAVYFGTCANGQGTWSFSAMQNQLGGTPPTLPPGVIVSAPDTDQNAIGITLSEGTHFGVPTTNTQVNADFSSMAANPPFFRSRWVI